MSFIGFAFLIFLSFNDVHGSPHYFVAAPDIIRYGHEEAVVLSVFDISYLDVEVYLQDYPDKQRAFSQSTVTVTPGQPSTTHVKVNIGDIPVSYDEQYVYLVVSSSDPRLTFRKESLILLHADSGYIFIQTDKPLYTPNQEVKIRIIPLDEKRQLSRNPVKIDIKNPQGVIVQRWNSTWTQKFISHTFQLPPIPFLGNNWTITAAYQDGLTTSTSVQFEVTEYVLPRFSVTVDVGDRRIVLPTTDVFNVTVTSRFVYGKPVSGEVSLVYGVRADGRFELCPFKYRKLLTNGSATFEVKITEVSIALAEFWFPDGARFQIEAEVLETASGRKERKLDSSLAFVQQPYRLSNAKSRKYFKPGITFEFELETLWATREVAPLVPVTLRVVHSSTLSDQRTQPWENLLSDANGVLRKSITTSQYDQHIRIQVKTNDDNYEDGQQTHIIIELMAMRPSSPGQYIDVSASQMADNIRIVIQTSSVRVVSVGYLVLSGGHIVKSGFISGIDGQFFKQFPIDGNMTPISRIIGYFIRQGLTGFDVIADSSVLQIEGRCQNAQLQVQVDGLVYLPGHSLGMNLNVIGAPNSIVGLVAVDKAVYLLNNRSRLTKEKMYSTLADHDTGCGNSGGRNTANIFKSSGIAVITNGDIQLSRRAGLGCQRIIRGKRSTEDSNMLQTIIDTHPCCVAGDLFSRNVTCENQCYDEGKIVNNITNSTGCAKVFYKCCKMYRPSTDCDQNQTLDRSQKMGEMQYTFRDIDIDSIQVRSYFPESWMFEEDFLDSTGRLTKNVALPDSITTHVIQSVSISPTHGMCVAEPTEIVTYREFFVDLDLPYSIVRMEQTEVRATIYNYGDVLLDVRVYVNYSNDICSGKSTTGSIRVAVGPNDAETVRFPIIPLKAGEFKIDVTAKSSEVGDRVQKTLLVINEGLEKTKSVSFWLDPRARKSQHQRNGDMNVKIEYPVDNAGVQESSVDLALPAEAIPGTGRCKVAATGNIMDTTVYTVIENVESFLYRVPHGCGEQTMVTLAPIVYALQYLHRTNQTTDAIKGRGSLLINLGYQRELLFRKSDGSFAIWPHKASSTWLTAFVMKVFCEAKKYAEIDPYVICSGIEYLFSRQNPDGSFEDSYPVYHKEMLGGNIGDVSRTAFVLAALLECDCKPPRTAQKVRRATTYLENNLPYIYQLYPLAITAYALALAKSPQRQVANMRLRSLAKEKLYSQSGPEGFRYWTVEDDLNQAETDVPYWYRKHSSAIDIEVTSYALLTQLLLNDIGYSDNIVEWLLQQRYSSGEFVSTQDTVIALQALSFYNNLTYVRDINMTLSLTHSSNYSYQQSLAISSSDVMVEKSIHDVPVNGLLNISTEGNGVARLDVEVHYNVNITEEDSCRFLVTIFTSDVQLNILKEKGYTPEDLNCDVCGHCTQVDNEDFPVLSEKYNVPDLNPRMRGTSRFRRNSLYSHGASKAQSCLEICVSYMGYENLDMPIVDVGLPTGFRVKEEDLIKLKETNTIDNFEISKRSVTLYLETIPSDEDLCFKFRVVKEFEVENLQAAKIEVYDFYKEDERCVKFYSLRYEVADLDIFCSKEDCHCVEGECAESYDTKLRSRQITRRRLYDMTCYDYEFVVRIEVTNIVVFGNHFLISTTTKAVLKPGKGNIENGQEVDFWMNLRCDTKIEINQFYIIYGNVAIKYIDNQGNERYRYYIQGDTVITKDYTRAQYQTNADYRHWGRYMQRMERYIEQRNCRA